MSTMSDPLDGLDVNDEGSGAGSGAEGGDNESVGSEPAVEKEEGEGVELPEGEQAEEAALPSYAIIRNADLPEDTQLDITDFVVASVEHNLSDPMAACKNIKENLDRIYGPGWHAVVGESFGFEISHDALHYVYVFYNGTLGILVWKCTANV